MVVQGLGFRVAHDIICLRDMCPVIACRDLNNRARMRCLAIPDYSGKLPKL